MSQKYSAYEKQDNRVIKPGLVLSSILIVGFIVTLGLILFDIATNPDTIDESNNTAVLGEFESTIDRYKPVETANYSLEVPEDWVQVNNPEILSEGEAYYPERFQGSTGADIGRRIDIYTDEIPDFAVERVMRVEGNGNSLIVGGISPQCFTFTDKVENSQKVPTSWEGLQFNCSMSTIANSIAAVETKQQNGVTVGGRTYYFVYTDHGSQQTNEIFRRILRTFKVK